MIPRCSRSIDLDRSARVQAELRELKPGVGATIARVARASADALGRLAAGRWSAFWTSGASGRCSTSDATSHCDGWALDWVLRPEGAVAECSVPATGEEYFLDRTVLAAVLKAVASTRFPPPPSGRAWFILVEKDHIHGALEKLSLMQSISSRALPGGDVHMGVLTGCCQGQKYLPIFPTRSPKSAILRTIRDLNNKGDC